MKVKEPEIHFMWRVHPLKKDYRVIKKIAKLLREDLDYRLESIITYHNES